LQNQGFFGLFNIRRQSLVPGCGLAVNIEKTAQSNASNPCTFTVTLSAEGSSTITGSPLYLVLVVDATSSMGTQDLKN
jgi:hypothetical protein